MKFTVVISIFAISLFSAAAFAEAPRARTQYNPAPGEGPLISSSAGSSPDVMVEAVPAHAVNATINMMGKMIDFGVSIQQRNPTSVENLCSNILNTCGIEPAGPQSAANFLESLNSALGSGQINRAGYCDCLRENVPHSSEAMNTLKTQIKTNLRSDVQNKLVRDFSQQLEDLHFYWKLDSFREKILDTKLPSSNRNVRCLAEKDYKDAFDQNPKCNSRLSDEEKERKIAEVFASFTDTSGGKLQAILSQVKNDVLMTDLKSSDCSSPANYSRVCFERDRISLARSKVGQISDRFLSKVLKSTTLVQNVTLSSRTEGHSPIEVLNEQLQEMVEARNPELLQLLDRETIGEPLYRKLTSGIQSGNLSKVDQDSISNSLKAVISSGVEIHPGISNLLSNVDKFEEVAGSLSGPSLMGFLEGDAEKIITDYRNKCDSLVKNVAEVVCSSDDDLLNGMNEHDLKEYTQSIGIRDDQTKNLTIVLACENDGSHAFMNHLLPGSGNSKISDYFARKKGLPSTFENLRAERFKEGSMIGQTVVHAVRNFGGSSSDFFDFDFFDASITESNFSKIASGRVPVVAPVTTADSKGTVLNQLFSNLPSVSSEPSQVSGDQSFYSNAMAASATTPENNSSAKSRVSDSRFDPRRELREYLRGKADDAEIDNLMSKTDDSMMQELMALKAEMDANQKKILELTAENERLKLQSMKNRMTELERERSALDPGEPRVRQASTVSRGDSPIASSSGARNIASVAPIETGGSNAGIGNASSSAEVSSDGASLSGLNRALLSSASGAARGPASDSTSDPVVVSASAAKSGSIEIRSQEVGLDLLNYLSNNGSDIQTLINLKTSGVIYKYQTLENGQYVEKEVLIEYSKLNEDVKKIIDQKIAQNKDRSREVLRLDNEIKELQRTYSYSALRLLLADQMRSEAQ